MRRPLLEDSGKEIFMIGRCPYCGDEVEIEPTDLCCGEVHGEYVYEDDEGNLYSEEYYRKQPNGGGK